MRRGCRAARPFFLVPGSKGLVEFHIAPVVSAILGGDVKRNPRRVPRRPDAPRCPTSRSGARRATGWRRGGENRNVAQGPNPCTHKGFAGGGAGGSARVHFLPRGVSRCKVFSVKRATMPATARGRPGPPQGVSARVNAETGRPGRGRRGRGGAGYQPSPPESRSFCTPRFVPAISLSCCFRSDGTLSPPPIAPYCRRSVMTAPWPT